MANTTNTQKPKSFDNVKNVKTNVVNVARSLQQTLNGIRQRANALFETIQQRKAEFIQQEVVDTPIEEVVEQVEEVSPVVVEEASEATDVVETEEPIITEEPAVEVVVEEQPKPKTKVVTTVENGREVKTYTDEKGNVKVRKFLDLSSTQKGASSASGTKRDGGAKPQQGARTPKTDQPQARRGGTTQQPRAGSGRTFAPVMDIPRNEPQKSHGNKNKTK